jgi:hypothetical protein
MSRARIASPGISSRDEHARLACDLSLAPLYALSQAELKPMRRVLLCMCLLLLCAGCFDVAARQQRKEDAQRQQVQQDLKDLGEKLHNEQSGESAADSTATVDAK